jgi:hypothetical protein
MDHRSRVVGEEEGFKRFASNRNRDREMQRQNGRYQWQRSRQRREKLSIAGKHAAASNGWWRRAKQLKGKKENGVASCSVPGRTAKGYPRETTASTVASGTESSL